MIHLLVLALFAGVVLAVPYVLYAGRARDPIRVFGVGLVVAALVYVVFALIDHGTRRDLLLESCAVLTFGILAVLGIRRSPWYLALGWVAHAGYDVTLHLYRDALYGPWWYPVMCLGFDLIVAGAILGRSRTLP
jgi:hypothetical protein